MRSSLKAPSSCGSPANRKPREQLASPSEGALRRTLPRKPGKIWPSAGLRLPYDDLLVLRDPDLTLLLDGVERPGYPLNRNDSPQDAQEAQGVQFPRLDENPAERNSPTYPAPGRRISKENLAAGEYHATIGLNGSTGAPSLHGRIGTEFPRFLTTGPAPFATWHNRAYVLGSFPCAPWCFLANPDAFKQTLFTAVDAGHDADTVAAMACTVSGADHGYSRLPQRLLPELEYHDRRLELAGGLYELNRRLYGLPEGRSIFGFDRSLRPTHHGAQAGKESPQRRWTPEFPERRNTGGGTGPALR